MKYNITIFETVLNREKKNYKKMLLECCIVSLTLRSVLSLLP